jgi:glycosyltransferase involved in cell wall biosynthesis
VSRSRRIVLLTQDVGFGGGIARVYGAARQVLDQAGYEVTPVQVGTLSGPRVSVVNRAAELRLWRIQDDVLSLQSFLPELQVTPLVSARLALGRVLRDVAPAQLVVVGAMLPYAWSALGHGIPVAAWAATTLAGERDVQWREFGRAQSAVHRATMPVLARAERSVFVRCERVAAMSRYGADAFAEIRGGPVAVVHPPVFPPFQSTDADVRARQDALEEGRLHVAFVGRAADPRKRFDRAVLVAGRLATASGLDVTLSVTATEAELGALPRTERLTVSPLGGVTDADLSAVLRSAHWLVMTSDQEGYGIVVAEAMACGAAVASTPCGGPESEIRESGAGMVGDWDGLADRIWMASKDPVAWATLSRRASEYAGAHFSPETTAQAFLDFAIL